MLQSIDTRGHPNLSIAWAKVFMELMSKGNGEKHPAVVVINSPGQQPSENTAIRTRLDLELKRQGEKSCATVAGTIFPTSMWNPNLPNSADALFARYRKAWPHISKCPANKKGVYFHRLTAFQSQDRDKTPIGSPTNQLEWILNNYQAENTRKSALQASVFDPSRDHTKEPYAGFPCLQHVTFTPMPDKKTLSVTGIYTKQLHFEKAYGNYLGLYTLGEFMAKEMGLQLSQVVCIASYLEFGDRSKTKLRELEKDIGAILKATEQECPD